MPGPDRSSDLFAALAGGLPPEETARVIDLVRRNNAADLPVRPGEVDTAAERPPSVRARAPQARASRRRPPPSDYRPVLMDRDR